jgi:hypothetical protein
MTETQIQLLAIALLIVSIISLRISWIRLKKINNTTPGRKKNKISNEECGKQSEDLDSTYMLPVDVKRFIVWLSKNDEWHYESTENLWRKDGFRSKTTDELYTYYLTKRNLF